MLIEGLEEGGLLCGGEEVLEVDEARGVRSRRVGGGCGEAGLLLVLLLWWCQAFIHIRLVHRGLKEGGVGLCRQGERGGDTDAVGRGFCLGRQEWWRGGAAEMWSILWFVCC